MSGVCGAGQTCSAPTCTDHVKNGKESDVDCGGRACSQCPALGTCDADSSCQSGVCTNGRCDAGLVVHYVTQTPGASETRVIPEIHLVNNGKNAVSLASLSLRYYFTVNGEDSTSVQVTQTSANTTGSAGGDITGVTSWMVVSIPPVFEADTYLSVSFPTATTSLAPGDTATIYSTLTFVDSGPMVQTNDYSFDAAATLDQPYDHIPVYSGTSLIYGVPPGQ